MKYDMHGDLGDFAGSIEYEHGVDEKLAPCPFCAEDDVTVHNTWTPHYWVGCESCGAKGPRTHTTSKSSFATMASAKRGHKRAFLAAIAGWNERYER